MEIQLNRSEKIIALIAVTAALAFILMFMQINFRSTHSSAQIDSRNQINYEMARPEESFSEYSLNGREVDQVYEALKKKEIAKALEKKLKKPQTEAEKKAELAKKKDEAAKKMAAQAQARTQQKTAQEKKSADQSQSNLSSHLTSSESDSANQTTSQNEPYAQSQFVPDQQSYTNPQNTPAVDAKSKVKKTFAEWRSLIFSKPTRETMNSFLEAHRKNEVTAAEVQALAQDLIDQNDDKLKGLGLYALRATPSLASLSQFVHAEAELNANLKTYVEQAYLSYLQPQNLAYLNQALQTKDKTLIVKSLNLLGVNLQKISKGDYTSLIDPRSRRDTHDAETQSHFSMNSYKGLIPALNTLGSSQDQELAGLAQQVMSYIQTSNNVALN